MAGLCEGFQLAGRYILIKPLRGGGSADVWQACDTATGQQVALKFSRCGAVGELTAEFEALKTLSHPAIVGVRGLATHDGCVFLVLELIDGAELSQYRGASYTVWLPMLRPVVAALEQAHRRGVVHGDLKLENMLVASDGSIRLIDFSGRPGLGVADDLRALGAVMTELATGLAAADLLSARLPSSLARLVADLVDQRADPPSLTAVAGKIDEVLNAEMKPGETEQFERIEPVARQTGPAQPRQVVASRRARSRWWLAAGAIVLVAVLAMLVLWARIDPNIDKRATPAAGSQIDQAQARMDDLSIQVQQQSASIYQKWLALETMDVSSWAELRARRALELLQEGEQLASEMNHAAALRLLAQSNELFEALLEQAPGIAADRRAAGWQAYRSGDATTAAANFRVALAIEPNDDEMRNALNRTVFLEQVTTLTRQARERESSGDLDGALAAMNEAFRIDPENPDVEREVARLDAALKKSGFQSTMSDIYAALKSKNFAAARQALRKAAAMRPGAPELQDARIQLELAERGARMTSLRASAIAAEKTEDWEMAIGMYNEMLALDPALLLAQQGRDRSRRLASLIARSETLLEASLAKEESRRQAETLLEQIASVEAHSPRLRSLEQQLQAALRLSKLPVTVRLRSDNITEIQVYRVGRLGAFDSRELELMPGAYIVVGTRAGYRDIRTELVVEAGVEPEPLMIRCEEQI